VGVSPAEMAAKMVALPGGSERLNVGKGLPTYCVTRAVGRQPFAANDKQSNQSTLKTLYLMLRNTVSCCA